MITVIGDVHDMFNEYVSIVQDSEYTIQLGDFGNKHTWNLLDSNNIDSNKHKVLAGNNDDYNTCKRSPFYMGEFGLCQLDNRPIFYIRGGYSFSRKSSYLEELNFTQMIGCAELYRRIKPSIIVSHVPPTCVNRDIFSEIDQQLLKNFGLNDDFLENTCRLGEYLLSIHRPKLWVFGHLHTSYHNTILGTEFVGLDKLETYKIL